MMRLYLLIGGFSAVLCILGGVWFLGGQAARDRAHTEQLEADKATNERINDAEISTGDADADLEWLRERGSR